MRSCTPCPCLFLLIGGVGITKLSQSSFLSRDRVRNVVDEALDTAKTAKSLIEQSLEKAEGEAERVKNRKLNMPYLGRRGHKYCIQVDAAEGMPGTGN